MEGEFKVQLKTYDSETVVKAFTEYFSNNLTTTFAKSAYQYTGIMKQSDFCAGYHTRDSLFLVYNREGTFLKVYVETLNQQDLNNLKNTLNEYFKNITEMLDRKRIKWSKPQATIRLENCPLTGFVKTKKLYLKGIIEDQREKLFIVPIGSVLASFLAIHWNILDKDEASKDLKKAVISTLEAYIGLLILLLIGLIFVGNKREFTFKI